uniref:Protein FRA10AC1 n=2 Tax=Ascaris TaxID=6251 RepID=A0A9J2P7K6_ASCLU
MSKRNPEVRFDDLTSEFEYGSDVEKKKSRGEFWEKETPGQVTSVSRSEAKGVFDEQHSRIERQKRRLMALDVYSRHKELINNYFLYYPGATKRLQRDTSKDRTDYDVLKERFRFLWDEKKLKEAADKSWEFRLAKKYYEKLFKEYCIADLTHYKKNKIAMRWRVEKEVRSGKGQFECGNKVCSRRDNLTSWEVNFAYMEDGTKKNALVKLRLCPECSSMLNYHSQKRRAKTSKGRQSRRRSPSLQNSAEVEQGEQSTSNRGGEAEAEAAEGAQAEDVGDSEKSSRDLQAKEEAAKMMNIWAKPVDVMDAQKAAEEDLNDFLDDMFM